VEIDNETTFTIQARDMVGRPIRAGSKWFVVRLSHQEESANSHMDWKADKGMVTDNNDGTYTARYTQRQVGKFYVSVLLGHMHISGSPFTVRAVSTVAHAANCVAFGDGLERAVIGRPAAFTIQAKDRYRPHAPPLCLSIYITRQHSCRLTKRCAQAGQPAGQGRRQVCDRHHEDHRPPRCWRRQWR
jgi:hypothetical protein